MAANVASPGRTAAVSHHPKSSVAREKEIEKRTSRPKKDGSAQKAAQDVAGLQDYQLGECLGKGAFGSVYKALNWGTGETVAVKQVKLADLPKSELRVIMLEIDLLKNLKHANIVKYHGFVKSAESLYILLEYCENGSLHTICKNFGKFPENLVALYMSQVLHGLLYLHEQGVIHRDIKGANILTTKEGLVKLADFGVATRTTGLHESSVVGTPYWMAPEIIELSGATTASDIWSLGCTVIELLDGKPPYHQLQPMPALFRIVNDDHPPLPEGASPAVRDFLMQCFQKDPNLRVSAKKLLRHPWIVNARRSDAFVPVPPTKYDEAVKSVQEWNEALKSPDANTGRKPNRESNASPIPSRRHQLPILSTPTKTQLSLAAPRTTADSFRSPESAVDDNWDKDFATAISPSALHLPHLKPQDNFAGKLSADKLKAYASQDVSSQDQENWDDNFEGDLTVKSPMQITDADPLQTIRPYFPDKATNDDIRHNAPTKSPKHKSSRTKTRAEQLIEARLQLDMPPDLTISSQKDRRRGDSRLALTNGLGLQPKHEPQKNTTKLDKTSPQSNFESKSRKKLPLPSGGSLNRHPSPQVSEAEEFSTRRSRSSVEIQRYAEDEDDEDYSDIFSRIEVTPIKADSESESEQGTLMLNSKLSNNSWLGDDDDEDDPFAQLEEGFDEMDLQANLARDKFARLCTQVEGLVGSLKISQPDEVLADLSDQLMDVLLESPETKGVIIASHGMLPILEILENCSRRDVVLRLLKIVNAIIFKDVEIQENLCFVGGIPIISKFASRRHPSEIRSEAAAFIRQIYQTSTLTLQMFVSCGGLNVLVEFLDEDYEAEQDLVLIGVNGIWNVFELQGPTPKNDFCRILSRSSVLYPLSLVLNRVLIEKGDLADLCEGRIVHIFYLFSQAENHVKEMVADRRVLKTVLKDLPRMAPSHQITMLKFIKNLSMLSTTLDALYNSNAIEVLIDLLSSSMKELHFKEISNQVLNTMYNLCRLSQRRQEDAALNGIIPLLQRVVKTERPLKEFALPILCDMAHSGKFGRKKLWQHGGLRFYISLLSDPYWQVTALDAIFVWLQEETAKVEENLLDGTFSEAIAKCFTTSKANAFENLLEPLQKLLRLSPPVALSLARPDLFSRILSKLRHNKAVIRLNLLRIVRSICDASGEDGGLLRPFGLFDTIQHLADRDSAVLVRNMASELLIADAERDEQLGGLGMIRTSRRASSSSSPIVATPPALMTSSSTPSTPLHSRSSQASSYFEARSRPPMNGTSHSLAFRPTSRDGLKINGVNGPSNSSNGSLGSSFNAAIGSPGSSRLPRTAIPRGLRTSLLPSQVGSGQKASPSAVPVSSPISSSPRRRRQTSNDSRS